MVNDLKHPFLSNKRSKKINLLMWFDPSFKLIIKFYTSFERQFNKHLNKSKVQGSTLNKVMAV